MILPLLNRPIAEQYSAADRTDIFMKYLSDLLNQVSL